MATPDRSLAKVWSRALFECGVSQFITDPDQDQSSNAAACRLVYPDARDRVLAARPWRFATKRLALSIVLGSETARATPEWTYLYAYPADCITARRMQDSIGRRHLRQDQQIQFSREYGGLYSNEANAVLIYTVRHEDVSVWPAPAIEPLVWAMGAELAMGLGKNQQFRRDCWGAFELALVRGSIPDLLEDPEGPQPDSEFTDARK